MVYVVSKVVLYNLILFFVKCLVFKVKVNSIVFVLLMFNDGDLDYYKEKVCIKFLFEVVLGV